MPLEFSSAKTGFLLGAIFLLTGSWPISAQEQDNSDNLLFVGTKLAYAKNHWRYSGEFQSRFKDNWSGLDNWFIEGVATYMPSRHWEIVPDFVSVKNHPV